MLVEKDIKNLYVIALIHPSKMSYIHATKVGDGIISKGVDSGNRDARSCILFDTIKDAKLFMQTKVNSTLNYQIIKLGNSNMDKVKACGLKEFKTEIGYNKNINCYLVRGLVKRNRNGKLLYEV